MFYSMITLDMYKSLANLLGAEVWIEYPVKDILVYDAAAGPVLRHPFSSFTVARPSA